MESSKDIGIFCKYACKECNYFTMYLSSYKRHLESMKHISKFPNNKSNYNSENIDKKIYKCECGKNYTFKSGLSRHKLLCNYDDINNNNIINELLKKNYELNNIIIKDKDTIIDLLKDALIKISSNNTNTIGTLNNNITNNVGTINNTNLNMMLFLDNYCKDAVSINQFVEGLEIEVEDLLHTKDKGIIQGISNIFVNALKGMDIYKRPIHCSDLKRSTIFIKDDESWTKGKESREKLSTAIKHISQMQCKLIPEWEATYGKELNKDDMDLQYATIVKKATTYIEPNSKEEDKIIKSIAKEVVLSKNELELISNE